MSVRTQKVSSVIKEIISDILQKNYSMEKYGLITVTEVRMSPDLKNAKIFISIFGDTEKKRKTLTFLGTEKSFIRSELGHGLRLKYTPALSFYLDESLDTAMRIETLLNEIHKQSEGTSAEPDSSS
ncbi:MAG: 30S ribosome-binding factor RbfA [bacterium]